MNITYGILEVETQEGGCCEDVIRSGIKEQNEAILIYKEAIAGKYSHHTAPRYNCNYYIILEV